MTFKPNAFSQRTLAQELDVSPSFIRTHIYSGKLKAFRLGHQGFRMYRADVEAWIASCPTSDPNVPPQDEAIGTPAAGSAMNLTRDYYSPRMLAEELAPLIKAGMIRSQINLGKLKAYRLGTKIIIKREDVETWLRNLPPATARKQEKLEQVVKKAQEVARTSVHRERLRRARQEP